MLILNFRKKQIMLKKLLLLSLCLMFVLSSEAQNMRRILKKRTAEACVNGSVGYYGNPHWSAGANIHYLHGIGRKKQWFSIGGGLRALAFSTKKRSYNTSSYDLKALNVGGADTVYMPEVQTNTLNAYIAMKLHIKRGVDIFFTTDIAGINFGDSKSGYFRSYETDPIPPGTKVRSEPYAFNYNGGYFTESYGSIMSELYGSFRLNEVLKWRLGLNYYRNEYKMDRNIPMNGKRFSQGHFMVMTGLAFDIRWHKTVEQSRYLLY
jgi:hypothetical protein